MQKYDDRFNKAVEVVLRHEGYFSNNKNDPGQATKFGISLRFLKANHIDIDLDGECNIDDIKALTEDKAREIYYYYWWKPYLYGLIKNLDISIKIFDISVNMGAHQAHTLIQRAINSMDMKSLILLNTDGIMGDKTLNAINFIEFCKKSTDLLNSIKIEAGKFYNSLVNKNPNLKIFYKGWMHRLND